MTDAQQLGFLTLVSAALFLELLVLNRKKLATLLPAFTPRAFGEVLRYVTVQAMPQALFNPAPDIPAAVERTPEQLVALTQLAVLEQLEAAATELFLANTMLVELHPAQQAEADARYAGTALAQAILYRVTELRRAAGTL